MRGKMKNKLFKNPIIIASGTYGYDGYGKGTDNLDFSKLGAVIPKTLTRFPRQGNPEPRWYPHSFKGSVLLNSIGLENPGIDVFLSNYLPKYIEKNINIIVSISADDSKQFNEMATMLKNIPDIAGIELNLSCPNTRDKTTFAYSPTLTFESVKAVRNAIDHLPIFAKLSPNVPNIKNIAHGAIHGGATGLTISNTIPGLKINVNNGNSVLGGGHGGMSGPALKPISLALVNEVSSQFPNAPILGCGGISEIEDALEYFIAGASAVQIGSANLTDFATPFKILSLLKERDAKEKGEDILSRYF